MTSKNYLQLRPKIISQELLDWFFYFTLKLLKSQIKIINSILKFDTESFWDEYICKADSALMRVFDVFFKIHYLLSVVKWLVDIIYAFV